MTFNDLVSIVLIALILFASGFALFLPIALHLKDAKTAIKFSIPLSISSEIIFGYIFYTIGQIRIFPLTYLIIILLINIFVASKLELFRKIKWLKLRMDWRLIVPVILIAISVIYARFFDAIRNIAPGAIDASAHIQYVIDLGISGHLSSVYYAPGFHILVFPIYQAVNIIDLYRFTGPVLGILTLLSLYLLFKDYFKNKLSNYLFVLAFGLPVFSILTLETISFFPTALTFIFLPLITYILARPRELTAKSSLLFCAVPAAALALSVPYLLVQFVPAIIFLTLIVAIARNFIDKKYFSFLVKIVVISIFGFILALGHVYLQNRLIKKDGSGGFPQIDIAKVQEKDSNLAPSTNVEKTSAFLDDHKGLGESIAGSAIVKKYLIPMFMTGTDVVSVKNIRPPNSVMSIAAYLIMIFSLGAIYLGIRKKDNILLVFGSLIAVFGLATQTGIFEMSTYRGRSGWYLLLFSLILLVYAFDKIRQKISSPVSYVLFLLFFAASFYNPPTFYRGFFSDYFSEGKTLAGQFKNQRILMISEEPRILIMSKGFVFAQFSADSIGSTCDLDQCFIIFENKFFDLDPVKSQSLLSTDKDSSRFESEQMVAKDIHDKTISGIKSSPNFSNYKIYFQNENISVYRFNK